MTKDDFKAFMDAKLTVLNDRLDPVLRALRDEDFPESVAALHFEVFHDGFTDSFPVRAFFLDKNGSEHFEYVDGAPRYPTDIDPQLIKIDHVLTVAEEEMWEEAVFTDDDDLGIWETQVAQLITWFRDRWLANGGVACKVTATIGGHDDPPERL